MRVRDLMRTLTPLGWLALAGAAVVLLTIAGRGMGLIALMLVLYLVAPTAQQMVAMLANLRLRLAAGGKA